MIILKCARLLQTRIQNRLAKLRAVSMTNHGLTLQLFQTYRTIGIRLHEQRSARKNKPGSRANSLLFMRVVSHSTRRGCGEGGSTADQSGKKQMMYIINRHEEKHGFYIWAGGGNLLQTKWIKTMSLSPPPPPTHTKEHVLISINNKLTR